MLLKLITLSVFFYHKHLNSILIFRYIKHSVNNPSKKIFIIITSYNQNSYFILFCIENPQVYFLLHKNLCLDKT